MGVSLKGLGSQKLLGDTRGHIISQMFSDFFFQPNEVQIEFSLWKQHQRLAFFFWFVCMQSSPKRNTLDVKYDDSSLHFPAPISKLPSKSRDLCKLGYARLIQAEPQPCFIQLEHFFLTNNILSWLNYVLGCGGVRKRNQTTVKYICINNLFSGNV